LIKARKEVTLATLDRITIDEVKKKMDRGEPILFIDTRNSHDWSESDVKLPGALRIHFSELEQRLDELPRDRLIVTYCT
jgi:rhodanese-related sulfurtransferase